MWILIVAVVTSSGYSLYDKSAPMPQADCIKAVSTAKYTVAHGTKSDEPIAVTVFCKKV